MREISISNKDYRKRKGISSTDLKHMVKSPAHFRYWKDNPQEDTPALLFGRAAHKYVLETYDFFTEFAVAPNVDRRTKDGKQIWNDFVADPSILISKFPMLMKESIEYVTSNLNVKTSLFAIPKLKVDTERLISDSSFGFHPSKKVFTDGGK